MELEYFCCHSCGYETNHEYIAYSRKCASGDLYLCPNCNEESSDFEEYKED